MLESCNRELAYWSSLMHTVMIMNSLIVSWMLLCSIRVSCSMAEHVWRKTTSKLLGWVVCVGKKQKFEIKIVLAVQIYRSLSVRTLGFPRDFLMVEWLEFRTLRWNLFFSSKSFKYFLNSKWKVNNFRLETRNFLHRSTLFAYIQTGYFQIRLLEFASLHSIVNFDFQYCCCSCSY